MAVFPGIDRTFDFTKQATGQTQHLPWSWRHVSLGKESIGPIKKLWLCVVVFVFKQTYIDQIFRSSQLDGRADEETYSCPLCTCPSSSTSLGKTAVWLQHSHEFLNCRLFGTFALQFQFFQFFLPLNSITELLEPSPWSPWVGLFVFGVFGLWRPGQTCAKGGASATTAAEGGGRLKGNAFSWISLLWTNMEAHMF